MGKYLKNMAETMSLSIKKKGINLQQVYDHMHFQKKKQIPTHSALESSIDHAPYVNVANGLVAAMGNELQVTPEENSSGCQNVDDHNNSGITSESDSGQNSKEVAKVKKANLSSIRRWLEELCRQNKRSTWLLKYIAILSTWPLVGAALHYLYKRKFKKVLPTISHK